MKNLKALGREFQIVFLMSRDVCRAAAKDRMMYGFLLLGLLFILLANVPFMVNDPKVFQGQPPATAAIEIGFMGINIFTLLIAVFASINTLQSFLSKESLILLLSKPIRRWQILEGVILGLFEMVFLNWFLMTMGLWCVLISQTRTLSLFLWSGFGVTIVMALVYVHLVVFFYTLVPNAVAGVLTILFLMAGFGAPQAREAFGQMTSPAIVRYVLVRSADILPQINGLWGISMNALGMFHIGIDPFPIFAQTFFLVAAVNILSWVNFRRLTRF